MASNVSSQHPWTLSLPSVQSSMKVPCFRGLLLLERATAITPWKWAGAVANPNAIRRNT